MPTYDLSSLSMSFDGIPLADLDPVGRIEMTLKSAGWVDYGVVVTAAGYLPELQVGALLFCGVPRPLVRIVEVEVSWDRWSRDGKVVHTLGVQVVDPGAPAPPFSVGFARAGGGVGP